MRRSQGGSTPCVHFLSIGNNAPAEFSRNNQVTTLFRPMNVLDEDEESKFWQVRVQLFGLDDYGVLYFDSRPTVQDALRILWNYLRPKNEYQPIWYLSFGMDGDRLEDHFPLYYYLTKLNEPKHLYLLEKSPDNRFLTLSPKHISVTRLGSGSYDAVFPKKAAIPNILLSDSIDEIDTGVSNIPLSLPAGAAELVMHSVETNEPDEKIKIFRNFTVLFPSLIPQTYLSIMLDITETCFHNILEIMEKIDQLKQQIKREQTEFAFFVPSPPSDVQVKVSECNYSEIEACGERQQEEGHWLSNEHTMTSALDQLNQTCILHMRPVPKQRSLALHILPSSDRPKGGSVMIYRVAEIKYEGHGDVLILFNQKGTVRDVINSIGWISGDTQAAKEEEEEENNASKRKSGSESSSEEQDCNLDAAILRQEAEEDDEEENSKGYLTLDKDNTILPPDELLCTFVSGDSDNSIKLTYSQDLNPSNTSAEEEQEDDLHDRMKEVFQAYKRFQMLSGPQRLKGEEIELVFQNTMYCTSTSNRQYITGSLAVTNYQLVFYSFNRSTYFSQHTDYYIPFMSISKVIELRRDTYFCAQIQCKDFRNMSFRIDKDRNINKLIPLLYAQPSLDTIFAFKNLEFRDAGHTLKVKKHRDGWNVYDSVVEYKRIGLTDENGWRISFMNLKYDQSPTYPHCFVVPANASDELLRYVCQFRSKARIPVTVWRHPITRATLTRCSQPRIGLKIFAGKTRSSHDEKLIMMIKHANPDLLLEFVDSRPKKNAQANHLRQGGFEDAMHYTDCNLTFLDIGNIHVVRESFIKLGNICSFEDPQNDTRWLSSLEATNWLQIVSSVLKGGSIVANKIAKQGISVVTHCSDGWDRTSQISAIAQFLMDPYYRTFKGFQVLIEKEWRSFGHMFETRVGHLRPKDQSNVSPIFLVFIDCIYQIMQQFPLSLEFNEYLLRFIMDHVYSGRFGTFLFDCDRQRREHNVTERTVSIWTVVNQEKTKYKNLMYKENHSCIIPIFALKRMQLWPYYTRFIPSFQSKESATSIIRRALTRMKAEEGKEHQ